MSRSTIQRWYTSRLLQRSLPQTTSPSGSGSASLPSFTPTSRGDGVAGDGVGAALALFITTAALGAASGSEDIVRQCSGIARDLPITSAIPATAETGVTVHLTTSHPIPPGRRSIGRPGPTPGDRDIGHHSMEADPLQSRTLQIARQPTTNCPLQDRLSQPLGRR
jgi:hypothetical protein